MPMFRKKPVEIEARLFTLGDPEEILKWIVDLGNVGEAHIDPKGKIDSLRIQTLEGKMYADLGDWVIKGVAGEFYPCKPDIFERTYEPVK